MSWRHQSQKQTQKKNQEKGRKRKTVIEDTAWTIKMVIKTRLFSKKKKQKAAEW